jgi:hypothetical protein
MASNTTVEQYLEKLTPMLEKVIELSAVEYEDESHERSVYIDLLNIIHQLQNDLGFLSILTVLEEQDIKNFYEKLRLSPNIENWAWGDWGNDMYQIKRELEGDYEFRSYGDEEIYNLQGSTLQATRISNKYRNLRFTLHNVGTITITRGKTRSSCIQVEVRDIHDNLMAEWDEYSKTKSVGLTRLSASHYEYDYRG